nr:MAG TPA: hypothetical protein [Caudoviricetes sp.]
MENFKKVVVFLQHLSYNNIRKGKKSYINDMEG